MTRSRGCTFISPKAAPPECLSKIGLSDEIEEISDCNFHSASYFYDRPALQGNLVTLGPDGTDAQAEKINSRSALRPEIAVIFTSPLTETLLRAGKNCHVLSPTSPGVPNQRAANITHRLS